ncbi:unnamed protein product [Polarella glacialis]|uniref:Prolyl 4-hydroxylase alpha subunit Fe(2+) 2OG dioxygenase domain-containing protein n=1 Tax=Polarella glacialis TaxID=89957 RepID=A0A813FEW0_POLGL|nr:unnamed protein product [Polarella glacialis]
MSVLVTGPLSPSGNPGAPRPPPPRPPALGHEVEHDPVVRRLSASGSLDAASNSKALVRRRTTISNCASPEAQEKLIQDLRNEGLQLQRKIDEIVAARSRGGRSDLEDKAQAEQLQAKDQRLVELRQMVNVEKESCDLGMQPLRNQVQDLESEHAALKMELQRAKGGLDQTDVGLLASDVQRAEDGHRQLMSQLDRLQANSFISKTDDRREASRRVVELEDLVQRKVWLTSEASSSWAVWLSLLLLGGQADLETLRQCAWRDPEGLGVAYSCDISAAEAALENLLQGSFPGRGFLDGDLDAVCEAAAQVCPPSDPTCSHYLAMNVFASACSRLEPSSAAGSCHDRLLDLEGSMMELAQEGSLAALQGLELLNASAADAKLQRLLAGVAAAEAHRRASPFAHSVLDGLLPVELLQAVSAELRDRSTCELLRLAAVRLRDYKLGGTAYMKFLWHSEVLETAQGLFTRWLFRFFKSAPFVAFLGRLTGVSGLLVDASSSGGGLHQIATGGFLDVHADFNADPEVKPADSDTDGAKGVETSAAAGEARELLQRRVNLIFFLNSNWEDGFGGDLELWAAASSDSELLPQVRIAPGFNRLVIFNHTDRAFHGHPWPLTSDSGRTRRSVALYYYTRGRPLGEASTTPHSTLYQNATSRCPRQGADAGCYGDGSRVRRIPLPGQGVVAPLPA